MAPSAPNHTPDPRPTGDLEHLFRQKFAEAEVTPRASLWEQLDHELLVQQNETYRRRLLGYRWAAAASLLLLAGGGTWLGLHQPGATAVSGKSEVAAAPAPAGPAASSSAGSLYTAPGQTARRQAGAVSGTAGTLAAAPQPSTPTDVAAYTSSAADKAGTAGRLRSGGAAMLGAGRTLAAVGGSTARRLGLHTGQRTESALGSALLQDGYSLPAATLGGPAGSASARLPPAPGTEALLARSVGLPGGAGFGRPETLPALPQAAGLLAQAEEAPVQEEAPETAKPKRWKFNAAYAASAFHPNANFSRGTTALAAANFVDIRSSGDAYEVAATEYRNNLQAGLGQRVSLTADYSLNEHWSLAAGLAMAQQEATSATSWYFLDGKSTAAAFYEPVQAIPGPSTGAGANVPPRYNMPLRNVTYRYRTASLPVSVRYTTGARQGWSIYAKLGAAVNVLLGSRTELEGVPEATRTYTLASADSPYRKVLASLHGGTGIRFRPATATWSLALGPDVEAGLTTLNAEPSQRLLRQARPYAIGMEASVEFGSSRAAKPVN